MALLPALSLALWLALVLAAPVAMAQGGASAAGAEAGQLPFVEASGLVSQNLRRSTVVRTLGAPAGDEKSSLLRYPQLGLSFALQPEGTPGSRKDPPVLWMQVMPPSRAQTFGGLHLGMPQALAVETLTRDYKLKTRMVGPQSGAPLIGMRVTDREQRSRRELEARFEGGALSGLTFTTHDPLPARDATKRTLSERPASQLVVIFVATLLALAGVWFSGRLRWWRRSLIPGHVAGPLGALVLVAGLVMLAFTLAAFRQQDVLLRLFGIIGLAMSAGAGLIGLGMMATSESRAFALPAKIALTLVVFAILLNQTGWFW